MTNRFRLHQEQFGGKGMQLVQTIAGSLHVVCICKRGNYRAVKKLCLLDTRATQVN